MPTRFFALNQTFVCSTCGSLVLGNYVERHRMWHDAAPMREDASGARWKPAWVEPSVSSPSPKSTSTLQCPEGSEHRWPDDLTPHLGDYPECLNCGLPYDQYMDV